MIIVIHIRSSVCVFVCREGRGHLDLILKCFNLLYRCYLSLETRYDNKEDEKRGKRKGLRTEPWALQKHKC